MTRTIGVGHTRIEELGREIMTIYVPAGSYKPSQRQQQLHGFIGGPAVSPLAFALAGIGCIMAGFGTAGLALAFGRWFSARWRMSRQAGKLRRSYGIR